MNAALAEKVIGTRFPDLRPGRVRFLGEGYDSTAFDVDGEWVFRFPKRADVERQLLVEMRILAILAPDSPLPIPEYCFAGAPSRLFPRHFGGYRKVPGVPAIGIDPDITPFDRLAPRLASFLSWLHAFPAARAARAGVPYRDADSVIEEARTEAIEDIEYVMRVAPHLVAQEWVEVLGGAPVTPGESPVPECLVHGDLAAEHILYEAAVGSISGVIDWSEVAIGDPSIDIAGVFHWGGRRVLDTFLSTYRGPADEATLARARYLAACRGIADVVFGIEASRTEYVAAGIRALNFSSAPGRSAV